MTVTGTDLNLLVALRALLEEVNVTRAGARIGMRQPAMSAALSRLRRHYRDELLVRVGREYELTPFARALLPAVQQTMPLVERALDLEDRFNPATSERVYLLTMSDYACAVMHAELVNRVAAVAPGVSFVVTPPWQADLTEVERHLLESDFLVIPRGYGVDADNRELFVDRFVCIVDPANPYLRDGRIVLDDLGKAPQIVGIQGRDLSLVDRALSAAGIERIAQVRTYGWVTLPFLVPGTDFIAIVPERLARRTQALADVVIAELPIGPVELVETLWWHRSRDNDPGHRWMREILVEVGAAVAAG